MNGWERAFLCYAAQILHRNFALSFSYTLWYTINCKLIFCGDYAMDEFAKTAYWLDCADYDLQTAKAMLETKRFLYVGFMCHQTIDKGVKSSFRSTTAKQ